MKSFGLRGSVIAAAASIVVLGCGITALAQAQHTSTANPELAAKGVWNPNTTYAQEDIVTARGSAWIAKRPNTGKLPGQTSPSTAADWLLFARGFNPLGTWSNATTYQPDDLVTLQGQTWRAKRTVTAGTAPVAGANWELFAAKGAAGPNTGIPDGTSSAPGISFDGDSNTGIYQPESGKIAIVEDGLLFMHNLGTRTAALGLEALSTNTTGTDNTAVGNSALKLNATGHFNTALGAQALTSSTQSANTGLGYRALEANTTGQFNTGVGYRPLFQNTTASFNTAVGANALSANQTGANNSALGHEALQNSLTADNTALGYQALKTQTTGHSNTAVGAQALAAHVSGQSNVAVGRMALNSNQSGSANTAVGTAALAWSTADANTAVGYTALQFNIVGTYNTAIGAGVLQSGQNEGSDNTGVGYIALNGNTTGTQNTGIGRGAATFNSTGSKNTAVGYHALGANQTGSDNVAIGYSAGGKGSRTIAIGSGAGLPLNANDSIFIGNAGETNDTATIRIGIQGTQTTTFIAGIAGVTAGDTGVLVDSTTGQLGISASSRRYKNDIETMTDVSGMLERLRPVTFRYKKAHNNGTRPLQYGLIAEEVADVLPDLAVFKDGRPETVKYHLLPSFLLAGYQAQQKTIAAQAEKIESQAADLADLKERLRKLEALLPPTRAAALQ